MTPPIQCDFFGVLGLTFDPLFLLFGPWKRICPVTTPRIFLAGIRVFLGFWATFFGFLATFFVFWGIYGSVFTDYPQKARIWPDLADLARFGQIRPDSARFGQIRPDSARFGQNGQIPGIRTILARGGPSSGILAPQIPDSGPPNWHKSGGGGISCIRSSGTLSPGTYRSQILARSGTRALGTRILGTFWEFSAEMDHFSGTPPEPDSGPPLAGFWTPPGRILGPPPGQIRPDSARFGQIRPDSARFGQIRPDSTQSAGS